MDFLIKAIKPSKQIHMGTKEPAKVAQIIAKTIIAKYRSITFPPYLVQFF
ncbi:redox-sensing transcriptional repressor Rex [Listeria marthii FSL S4-120]|uniref:Redox-sensing transcriptional repressor Rex n=1 Tax=Listeria marthii FSL S4-120 TaxID=702457 RepID=A0ABN0BXA1_9LIST|nr:redox-sensing transcriptional repressor Rex [Listeria marthii FSL S4-120]